MKIIKERGANQGLCALTVRALVVCGLLMHAPDADVREARGTYTIDLAQVHWDQSPSNFVNDGELSPARCHIETVEDPHVSTCGQVMNQARELKGNAVASCDSTVDELTLSVSILNANKELLVKGPLSQNKRQKTLSSRKTPMPCGNANMTTYQIAALGTSYENGKLYTQIRFGNVGPAPCGPV